MTWNSTLSLGARASKTRDLRIILFILVCAGCGGCAVAPGEADELDRAIRFLRQEVPAWSAENKCFSCHNNGDGARALFTAARAGYTVPVASLQDTLTWIAAPTQWDKNRGDPGFSDQRLANIQFASTLSAAVDAGHLRASDALMEASKRIIADQDADGAWPIDAGNPVGSPVTYGTVLATATAAKILQRSDAFPEAIESAVRWLNKSNPINVPAAAALLSLDQISNETKSASINFLLSAQTSDGGWGPYANSPAEAYDTALTLIALSAHRHRPGVAERIERGRKFLKATQQSDGSWPTTTRPSGGESYAQSISTTAWATMALLATK